MTRQPRTIVTLIAGLLLGAGATVGVGFLLLDAFNPVADEYVCSEGEVPAGPAPVAPGQGNECFEPGALPSGFEADPFGNRPLSYNCDEDGFRLLVMTEGRGAGQVEECVADDLTVPWGWAPSDDG